MADVVVAVAALPTPAALEAAAVRVLPPAEHAEAAARGRTRDRYLAGRVLLRRTVATLTGVASRQVTLDVLPSGRPVVASGEVAVSLSHSRRSVCAAVSRVGPVGIDVEADRPLHDAAALRRRVGVPPAPDGDLDGAILDGWVVREAALKALGDGLQRPLVDLTVGANWVRVRGGPTLALRRLDLAVHLGPGYRCALATAAPRPRVRVVRDALLTATPPPTRYLERNARDR